MTEQQTRRTTQGPDGTFVASLDTAERDAQMARRRAQGASYRTIAAEFGVSVSTAHEAVQRALNAARAEAGEQARQMELARLDSYIERMEQVLAKEHIVISHGHVVMRQTGWERNPDGTLAMDADGNPVPTREPVPDDAPVMAAVDRLLRLSESRRKLLGLDAAQKMDVSGNVSYTVVGVSDDDL